MVDLLVGFLGGMLWASGSLWDVEGGVNGATEVMVVGKGRGEVREGKMVRAVEIWNGRRD